MSENIMMQEQFKAETTLQDTVDYMYDNNLTVIGMRTFNEHKEMVTGIFITTDPLLYDFIIKAVHQLEQMMEFTEKVTLN